MPISSGQRAALSGIKSLTHRRQAERLKSISPRLMTRPTGRPATWCQSSSRRPDPAAQWTGAMRGPAFFAYSDNYLIDIVKYGIIMDVEASRAIRQAEVGAAKTMIERPERCSTSSRNGSRVIPPTAESQPRLAGHEANIAPHIPVVDSRSARMGPSIRRLQLRQGAQRYVVRLARSSPRRQAGQ